jgi:hypothetical protein
MDNFNLKKYLAENRLTTNSKILAESGPKIMSQEFGGIDDSSFLKVIWNLHIDDLKNLLQETMSDIKWIKNIGTKGKIMRAFDRRQIQMLNFRLKLLKQVISSKQKSPEYIPDSFKI